MSDLDTFRARKDAFFRTDQQSPLQPAQQAAFEGLRYYPERPDLEFELTPQLVEEPERIEMATSTGGFAVYQRWATVDFEVDGVAAELTVYRDLASWALFLPFQDANAGGETYGAGRYLDVHELEDGRLLVDFNYAYNPYCAYNDQWSCPIPPAENRLSLAIRAGEMAFTLEGH
jgi:uncharacterized protein (DUF1684 family)